MDANELILNKEDNGDVIAAGYVIDSELLRKGLPAAVIKGGGANAYETLKLGNYAVPVGLFYLHVQQQPINDEYDEEDIKLVEDTLYDKLLAMVDEKEQTATPSKKTHKHRHHLNKKTKRNRRV